MKFTLARANRPRNPMVAPALFRQAGSHRSPTAAQRQKGQRALARELRETGDASTSARTPPDRYSP